MWVNDLSLSSTEGPAHFEVVIDLTGLRAGVKGHVSASSIGTLDLNVKILKVINTQGLTLGSVKLTLSFCDSLGEALTFFFVTGGACRVM